MELISNAKKAENYKLAEDTYNKAKRKSSTTLTRWSPDWEQSARYYRDSIKYYKLSGDVYNEKLLLCYKESAIAHEQANSPHTAAQHYEAAAELQHKLNSNKINDIIELYRSSSKLYRLNGSSDSASKVLVKAGDAISTLDIQLALQCYIDACSIYEDDNRGELSDHTFKRTIIFAVKSQRYDDAIAVIKRQNEIYIQHINTFQADLYRNYLSIIILRFHTHQYERACNELTEYESSERFNRSNEYLVAQQIIDSYHNGSQDELDNIIKTNSTLKYLIPPIASLVKKIKFNQKALFAGGGKHSNNQDVDEIDLTGATIDTTKSKLKSIPAPVVSDSDSDNEQPVLKPSKHINNNNATTKTSNQTSVKSALMAKAPKKVVESSSDDDVDLT